MKRDLERTPSDDPPPASRGVRWLLSGLLALHLVAVLAGPLAVQPSSALEGGLWSVFRPYLEAASLNNGYRFFAPEPGPSHLVRYELTLADGSRVDGKFPDIERHRPRLFYHRHFMLSEKLAGPPGSSVAREWPRSYAEHLKHRYGAVKVILFLVRHYTPPPELVADEGLRLDDPETYEEWEIYPVDRRPLGPPPTGPRRPSPAPEDLPPEALPPGEPL